MTDTPTAAALVAMTGRALFGDTWQTGLAAALKVNYRTLQRVARADADGVDHPSARLWLADCADLIEGRIGHLDDVAAILDRFLRQP